MELRGNLKDFSLPDIIQLVGFGRKTGALRLHCPAGDAALYFDEGNVVHAEYPGTAGEQAVFQLFHVPEGEFRFQTEVAAPGRTIAMDPTNLIMEAARLLDESNREDQPELDFSAEINEDAWFGAVERPRDPSEIKQDIKALLQQRFGRSAKKLIKAVDQCGDSVAEMDELAERLEKYVHVFLDNSISGEIGKEIRELISGTPSSS